MPVSWEQIYTQLMDFIREHPDIKIQKKFVHIPSDTRPEFYRLFSAVRTAFIEEKLPSLIAEASNISQNYIKAEQAVTEMLELEKVTLPIDLGRFTHNPIDQLARSIYDHLFDLIKGRINHEIFETRSIPCIVKAFNLLCFLGYEKWMVLSLLKLAEADRSFQFLIKELTLYDVHKAGGPTKEKIPIPVESKSISFKHEPEAAFIVPDVLAHSNRLNKYIGIKSQIGKALGVTDESNEKRQWLSSESLEFPDYGLTLVYADDTAEDIALISDAKQFCRPNLIIQCRVLKNWYKEDALKIIRFYHDTLKPTTGTVIVTREPVEENVTQELTEGISLITVGFDMAKLEYIVAALKKPESKG
ncbi:hypothetical protein ACFLYS_00240 [Chloroflexota bacterium]